MVWLRVEEAAVERKENGVVERVEGAAVEREGAVRCGEAGVEGENLYR